MFTNVIHVKDYCEIGSFQHYGALLLCEVDAEILLPPINRCNNFVCCVLPIGQAKVTLTVSDNETKIDAGHGPLIQIELTEQRIHTLISAGRWLVTR